MITYPKAKIDRRWDNMPMELRKALYSPAYGKTLLQIAKEHHLNEIKTEKLFKLVSFVLYGFIHKEELDEKILKETEIDKKVAEQISDKVDKKIFSQFLDELNEIYSPVAETDTNIANIKHKTDQKIGNIEISHKEKPEQKGDKEFIKSEFQKEESQKTEEKNKETPFVIHQEEKREEERPKQKKDFSFSFGDFFEKQEKDGPSAKVQTPKKDQKRTVHYSEYRTPASSDNDKSFINIANQKNKPRKQPDKSGEAQKQKEAASKPEKQNKKIDKDKKKNNPSVSGNTIDLSNLN